MSNHFHLKIIIITITSLKIPLSLFLASFFISQSYMWGWRRDGKEVTFSSSLFPAWTEEDFDQNHPKACSFLKVVKHRPDSMKSLGHCSKLHQIHWWEMWFWPNSWTWTNCKIDESLMLFLLYALRPLFYPSAKKLFATFWKLLFINKKRKSINQGTAVTVCSLRHPKTTHPTRAISALPHVCQSSAWRWAHPPLFGFSPWQPPDC